MLVGPRVMGEGQDENEMRMTADYLLIAGYKFEYVLVMEDNT